MKNLIINKNKPKLYYGAVHISKLDFNYSVPIIM